MGRSSEVAAAAVVAGAFTGDGIARVSDALVLTTDMVGGVTPARQSSIMARLVGPGWVATLALMIYLGICGGGGSFDGGAVTEVIETEFSVSLRCLLPLLIVFIISTRSSAFFAVLGGALSAVLIAGFTQRSLIERLAGDDRACIVQWAEVSIETLANGFDLDSPTVELNSIFFGGARVRSAVPGVTRLGASFARTRKPRQHPAPRPTLLACRRTVRRTNMSWPPPTSVRARWCPNASRSTHTRPTVRS